MRGRVLVLLAALASFGAAAQERVEFPSADAHLTGGAPTTLSGLLRKPAKGDGPFPAIVGLHGCAGLLNEQGRERGVQRQWGRLLVGQGYIVLMVDSFLPRGVGNACGSGDSRVSATSVRPYDALSGLRYLQSRGDVKPDRIGLIGWSHGGGAAVHAMRAEFVPNDGPYFRAGAAFYPGSCSRSWLGDFRAAAPLVVLIGEHDNWTAPRPCAEVMDKAKAAGQPVEFVLYPDAVHSFDSEDQPVIQLHGIFAPPRPAPYIGTNVPARDDSRRRVTALFERHLKGE